MEGLIHEEVNSLIMEVGRMAGPDWEEPVELHDVLGTSGINVLWHVMAGIEFYFQLISIDEITFI